MKPERTVEIILWDWLRQNQGDVEEVYFNSTNELGWKKFRVEGLQQKPDLIIQINKGYGSKFFAVEVKNGEDSLNVLKGWKIVNIYFKNYIEEKTKYFIEDKQIEIDTFLIATQFSLKGYLFKDESIIDNLSEPEKKSKFTAANKYKIIPRKEGHRTFEFIRFLWRTYAEIRNNYNKKVGLGILIADSEQEYKPSIMITYYNIKTKRWSQRWWRL